MASYPEIILQFAPGTPALAVEEDDWFEFDPTTVMAIDIVRGKQESLDEIQPGTLTVTLNNEGRTYDPLFYQDTIYSNFFDNGVRVRVLAYDAESDTTYSLFNGFIDGWPQQYQSHPGAIATLEATDAYKYINRASWAEEQYERTIMDAGPVAYYRMNDVNQTMLDNTDNAFHGVWDRDVKVENGSNNIVDGLVTSTDHAVSLSHPQELDYLKGEIPAEALPNLQVMSFEFWVRVELPPFPVTPPVGTPDEFYISYARLFGDYTTLTQQPLVVKVVAGDEEVPLGGVTNFLRGAFLFELYNSDGTQYVTAGTGGYYDADGNPNGGGQDFCDDIIHHFVWTVDTSSGVSQHLYVDGVEFPEPADDQVLWTASATRPSGAAELPIRVNPVYHDPPTGLIPAEWGDEAPLLDEVALYDRVLTSTEVLQHYNDGINLWANQRTGQRLGAVFNLMNWPLYDYDLGQTTLGQKENWDDGPIEYINKVVRTEQGSLTVAHHLDGQLLFKDRNNLETGTRSLNPQAVFTDEYFASSSLHAVQRSNPSFLVSSVQMPVRYSDIVLRWDEKQVVNQVSVKWHEGEVTLTTVTNDDEAVSSKTIDTLLESEAEARSLASWFLNHYSSIFPRLESVTVRPSAMQGDEATEAWRACLDLREGDRIQVVLTPQGIDPAISLEVLVEGIEHHLTNGVEWETLFYCSSAALQTNYWVLGVSELDDTTLLGY